MSNPNCQTISPEVLDALKVAIQRLEILQVQTGVSSHAVIDQIRTLIEKIKETK